MPAPSYSYPPVVFTGLIRDLLLLHMRDFHQDSQACMSRLHPPLMVSNPENIPQRGPCVITVNHYHRPGFGAEWLALSISALVSVHVHWIMTAEFMYEGRWFQPVGSYVSRILLKRIARVYGFTCMPPMPPRLQDVQARAAAIRVVLEVVRNTREPVLGFAPEGHDTSDKGMLTRPPAGVGRFGLLLAKAGLTWVPVGAYEADGVFHLRFGKSYVLRVPPGLHAEEKDRQASQSIMEHIAFLLPPPLRGEFA